MDYSNFEQSLTVLPNSYMNQNITQVKVIEIKRTLIEEVILFWLIMTGKHWIYSEHEVLIKTKGR